MSEPSESFLTTYCGSSSLFNNNSIAANQSQPQDQSLIAAFTNIPSCFQYIFIPLIPLCFLLICLPVTILSLSKYSKKNYTIERKANCSALYLSKISINICLIVLWLMVFVTRLIEANQNEPLAYIWLPFQLFCGFGIALYIEYLTHAADQKRSGLLFIFWLISLCGAVFLLVTAINDQKTEVLAGINSGGRMLSITITNLILNFGVYLGRGSLNFFNFFGKFT